MLLLLVYSVIITVIVGLLVKASQDRHSKNASKNVIGTCFFVFIISLVVLHFMGLDTPKTNEYRGGFGKLEDYESSMIENISENIHTGFAPF